MILKLPSENKKWVYNSEAVIAVVGNGAQTEFDNIGFTEEDRESAFPLVCFDVHTAEDVNNHSELRIADMMFVVSELETQNEYDICKIIAQIGREASHLFLVTHGRNLHRLRVAEFEKEFGNIILVEDDAVNIFSPVKHLLIDLYKPSFIGIDMGDILLAFEMGNRRYSYYSKRRYDTMSDMISDIPEMQNAIGLKTNALSKPSFIVFMELEQSVALERIDEFLSELTSDYPDSQFIWSLTFNEEQNDKSCTLQLQTVIEYE